MKTEIRKEKRKDVFQIDPRALMVEEGFNIRQEYGDIEDLSKSITQRGVMVPMRGYRNPDNKEQIVIVDGHRRKKAIDLALKNGADIAYVPVILETRGYSKEDRILDMFTLNDGKRLEAIEEGELFKRLKSLGWEEKDISAKTGKSLPHVYKMIDVANSPMTIKKSIAEGEISASTVSQIITSTKDEEEQKEMVNDAIKNAKAEGKNKATTRHVKKVAIKNPIKLAEEAIKKAEEMGAYTDRLETIKSFMNLIKKKPELDEVVEFLNKI